MGLSVRVLVLQACVLPLVAVPTVHGSSCEPDPISEPKPNTLEYEMGFVGFENASVLTNLIDQALLAEKGWNDPACNKGGDDFPKFMDDGAWNPGGGYSPGDQVGDAVKGKIRYEEGLSPYSALQGSCAHGGGGVILMHGQVKLDLDEDGVPEAVVDCPAKRVLDGVDVNYNKGMFRRTAIHEAGHLLGMGNTTCSNGMMSGIVYNSSLEKWVDSRPVDLEPHADECAEADRLNVTNEEIRDECDVDPSCEVDDPTITPSGPLSSGPDGPDPPGSGGAGGFPSGGAPSNFTNWASGQPSNASGSGGGEFHCVSAIVGGLYFEICVLVD